MLKLSWGQRTPTRKTTNHPVVFISYSHDSSAHKKWVEELAGRLMNNGVDVILDQWELEPGDDVPKFMEQSVRRANKVLMICTEPYVRKADDGKGGVGYESMIVTGELAEIRPSGSDLDVGGRAARIVPGGHRRRCLEVKYKALNLWEDGTLIFSADALDFVCWRPIQKE